MGWIGCWLSVADFRLAISEKRPDEYENGCQRPLKRVCRDKGFSRGVVQALLCSWCYGLFAVPSRHPSSLGQQQWVPGVRRGCPGHFLSCCGTPRTMSTRRGARWFSLELTRDSATWASKAVAALELFALVSVLDDFLAWVEEAVEGLCGHQWFHRQCGKRGGAEQTDDIEISSGGHPDRAG